MKLLYLFLLLIILSHSKLLRLAPASSIVMYWGQDAAADNESSLATFCAQANYDVINLSFMISFIDTRQPTCGIPNAPDLNFANHENQCTTFPNCPFLLNCASTIGVDIGKCQGMGKKLVMSLGGGVGSYGFRSEAEGTSFAGTMWNMFFEGNSTMRPFGNAVVDGIDLDIEGGSTVGYVSFVKTLRGLMSRSGRSYLITGAPQCPFPDAYLGPKAGLALGDAGSSFSYVSVQFYNNYCSSQSPTNFWSTFEQWNSAAAKDGYHVMVGLPSAPAAGGGWVSADVICGFVPRLKTYSQFGGFMFWDASWDMKNGWYSQQIRKCL